jgi:hypothetical protein
MLPRGVTDAANDDDEVCNACYFDPDLLCPCPTRCEGGRAGGDRSARIVFPHRSRIRPRGGPGFYEKYIDIGGLPVVASGEVADLALQRTHEIVSHMLAGRPDILRAMVERGMYLVIIGKDQVYTDMPEYRNTRNPDS